MSSELVIWESSRDPRLARLERLHPGALADSLPNDAGLVVVSDRLRRYLDDKRAARLEYRAAPVAGYVIVDPPRVDAGAKIDKKILLWRGAAGVTMRRAFAEELVEEGFTGIAYRDA
jgi:hypothetical protein